jgi:hypothetical protein
MKIQILDALWKCALLWTLLYAISGDETEIKVFSGLCLGLFIWYFLVIIKPLSYPIKLQQDTSPDP